MTNDRNKEKGGGGGAASKTAIGSDLGIEFSRADYDMINEIHSFESQGCNSIDIFFRPITLSQVMLKVL